MYGAEYSHSAAGYCGVSCDHVIKAYPCVSCDHGVSLSNCTELAHFSGYDQSSWQPQDPNDSRRNIVLATVCNVSYNWLPWRCYSVYF